ncbi:hypothetical protein CLOM_g5614 [Closterium sp. NIES-68]|nr:hypothetical protein CLOM_g5329 [Closterium sp. NIES-68]GJP46310.1 hypothetical protein CLOM_g5614 [Closterium sp. NIES-68]
MQHSISMEVIRVAHPRASLINPSLHSSTVRLATSRPPPSFSRARVPTRALPRVTCESQAPVVVHHVDSAKRGRFPAADEIAGSAAPITIGRRAFVATSLLFPFSLNVQEAISEEEQRSDGLRLYEDAASRFAIRVPAAWEQREKAGATALFADPERRGDNLGVVVNPVRVRSLRDFGDIDLVAPGCWTRSDGRKAPRVRRSCRREPRSCLEAFPCTR